MDSTWITHIKTAARIQSILSILQNNTCAWAMTWMQATHYLVWWEVNTAQCLMFKHSAIVHDHDHDSSFLSQLILVLSIVLFMPLRVGIWSAVAYCVRNHKHQLRRCIYIDIYIWNISMIQQQDHSATADDSSIEPGFGKSGYTLIKKILRTHLERKCLFPFWVTCALAEASFELFTIVVHLHIHVLLVETYC